MPPKRKLCAFDQWCGSVKAPPVKKSLQESALPQSRDTISNHKVGFRDAWTTGQSWLKYDGLNNAMLCSLCLKHWIKGQNGLQIFCPLIFSSELEHCHLCSARRSIMSINVQNIPYCSVLSTSKFNQTGPMADIQESTITWNHISFNTAYKG